MTDRAGDHQGRTAIWRALVVDPKHGPLPALLLILTVVTGTVDAVSILSLGRVFVANMTGNVVFVGFALAGAPGFSLSASLFALVGFLIGAYGGGVAIGRHGDNRAVLFRQGSVVELAFLLAALTISALASTPFDGAVKDAIAITAAIALGLQNAVVRRLAVPDLTTTVLTMTLTGIAADVRAAHFGAGRSALAGRGDDVGRGGGGCPAGPARQPGRRPRSWRPVSWRWSRPQPYSQPGARRPGRPDRPHSSGRTRCRHRASAVTIK